jgi:phosphosulfolactate synthase (CoM biosynthesis protein A)
MTKGLIRSVGPDVNLGNVAVDMLLELECARVGLGTEGPPGMRNR